MTEAEWLASADPAAMLNACRAAFLDFGEGRGVLRGHSISPRKLRLFACACCRAVWDGAVCGNCRGEGATQDESHAPGEFDTCDVCHGTGRTGGLTDPRSRRAVEVAERYADGLATERERYHAWDSAIFETSGLVFAAARCADDDEHISIAPAIVCQETVRVGLPPVAQAALLRDIVGNPFRPVMALYITLRGMPRYSMSGTTYLGIDPDTVTPVSPWLTPTVLGLARAAYGADDARQWPPSHDPYSLRLANGFLDSDRLAVLADALEDAGCPPDKECPDCPEWKGVRIREGFDAVQAVIDHGKLKAACRCAGTGKIPNPILTHLRGPGPHVRGCWVVDLLLGKE